MDALGASCQHQVPILGLANDLNYIKWLQSFIDHLISSLILLSLFFRHWRLWDDLYQKERNHLALRYWCQLPPQWSRNLSPFCRIYALSIQSIKFWIENDYKLESNVTYQLMLMWAKWLLLAISMLAVLQFRLIISLTHIVISIVGLSLCFLIFLCLLLSRGFFFAFNLNFFHINFDTNYLLIYLNL